MNIVDFLGISEGDRDFELFDRVLRRALKAPALSAGFSDRVDRSIAIYGEAERWIQELKAGDGQKVHTELIPWLRRSPDHWCLFLMAAAEEHKCEQRMPRVLSQR